MRHNSLRHGLEPAARDAQERRHKLHRECALDGCDIALTPDQQDICHGHAQIISHAIQCFAQYHRDRDRGWEPDFIVRPTHHAIFRMDNGEHVCDVSYVKEDSNHGLPSWFWGETPPPPELNVPPEAYEHEEFPFDNIPYDEVTGAAEWVPGIGPAPIWSHPDAARTMTRNQMNQLVGQFIKECFG